MTGYCSNGLIKAIVKVSLKKIGKRQCKLNCLLINAVKICWFSSGALNNDNDVLIDF